MFVSLGPVVQCTFPPALTEQNEAPTCGGAHSLAPFLLPIETAD
jgi:hypothetical protein